MEIWSFIGSVLIGCFLLPSGYFFAAEFGCIRSINFAAHDLYTPFAIERDTKCLLEVYREFSTYHWWNNLIIWPAIFIARNYTDPLFWIIMVFVIGAVSIVFEADGEAIQAENKFDDPTAENCPEHTTPRMPALI